MGDQISACVSTDAAEASGAPVVEAGPSVAALLTRSRAHHQRKTELANRFRGKVHVPNYRQAEHEAAQALALRLQAHDLDPNHLDPEWANDKAPHAEIVAFLTKYESLP